MVEMYLGYMSSVLTSVIFEGLALQIKLQKDLVACLSSFLLVVMSRDDGLFVACMSMVQELSSILAAEAL